MEGSNAVRTRAGDSKRVVACNVKSIAALKKEDRQVSWRVKGEKGLVVIVHASGAKAWAYRNNSVKPALFKKLGDVSTDDGRDGKMTLAEATAAADALRGQLKQGEDPRKPPKLTTFGQLAQGWLNEHAKKRLKAWKAEKDRYERFLAKTFGERAFEGIDRREVKDFITAIAEKRIAADGTMVAAEKCARMADAQRAEHYGGMIQANRVAALYQRIANWAVDEGHAKVNLARGMKKPGKETRRERTLKPGEARAIWLELERPLMVDHSAGGLTDADLPRTIRTRLALRLAFLTGQRRSEVAHIKKMELDLTEGDSWWIIPGDRTKNGLKHEVPLGQMAVAVVRTAMQASGNSEFLFPNDEGDAPIREDGLTKQLARICKRLGIGKVKTRDQGTDGRNERWEGIGPHAFRKSIGVALRKAGVDTEDRAHLFNHIEGAKSKVTSWEYDSGEHNEEKRRAQEAWERELRRVLDGADRFGDLRLIAGGRTAG